MWHGSTLKPLTHRPMWALVMIAVILAGTSLQTVEASHPGRVAAAPTPGGALKVRDTAAPSCIDPIRALDADEWVDLSIFDNLVTLDPHGVIHPGLATRWTFGDGGRRITFSLRQGVRFWNGDPLNAAAVKFNLERAAGSVGQQAGIAPFLGPLKTIRILGPYRLQIVLSTPFRPLLRNLSNDSLGMIDPKTARSEGLTKLCVSPVGSGPFALKTFAPGGNPVVVTRNPDHTWEPGINANRGRAYLSSITFRPIASDSTAVSALLSGEVDLTPIAGSQMARVEHNPAITLRRQLELQVYQLGFNLSHRPLTNLAVRRALSEAVDRTALIRAALNGLGVPSFSPIARNLPFYDTAAKQYAPSYNPTAARKALAANRVTGPLTLLSFNSPTDTNAAELIQAELSAVGVRVNIVSKPIPDFLSIAAKGQFDLYLDWYYGLDPDVLFLTLHSTAGGGGGFNFTFYKSAALDNLIDIGRSTLNTARARQAYVAVQRFSDKKVLTDPLWQTVGLWGMHSNVHGFHTDSTGLRPIYADLYETK